MENEEEKDLGRRTWAGWEKYKQAHWEPPSNQQKPYFPRSATEVKGICLHWYSGLA